MNVENVGNYKIVEMPNGMYAVSLTNGNMGAFITDEAGLLKFKEKYANKGDAFVSSGNNNTENLNKPKMSYEEARSIVALALMPNGGFWAVINPKYKEALEALAYYNKINSNVA